MRRVVRLLLAAALILLAPRAGADSLRCDGGLVAVGDSKLDLLGKCGQPALREAVAEERASLQVDAAGTAVSGQRAAVTVERWTYNFGPRRFVQHVRLEGGLVTAVEQGGYGYDLGAAPDLAPAIPRARCDQLGFHLGDSTFDLLARCGEPATRDVRVVTRTSSGPSGGGAVAVTTATELVEVWTYDLGPRVLSRRLLIEAGRLVRIDTGGYGYSHPAER